MKKILGGRELLMKARNEAKRQDKKRIKRQVRRQIKSLTGKAEAPAAPAMEASRIESTN
jgi:hypothetical protein